MHLSCGRGWTAREGFGRGRGGSLPGPPFEGPRPALPRPAASFQAHPSPTRHFPHVHKAGDRHGQLRPDRKGGVASACEAGVGVGLGWLCGSEGEVGFDISAPLPGLCQAALWAAAGRPVPGIAPQWRAGKPRFQGPGGCWTQESPIVGERQLLQRRWAKGWEANELLRTGM